MDLKWRTGKKALLALTVSFMAIAILASSYSSMDVHNDGRMLFDDGGQDPTAPLIEDPYQNDQKEVEAGISGLDIFPSDMDVVYPNTPFTLRIRFFSFSPENIDINMDRESPNHLIDHDITTGEFSISASLAEIMDINEERSGTSYNASSGEWETEILITFNWNAPGEIPRTITAKLSSTNGHQDVAEFTSVYRLEKDIDIVGETLVEFEDNSYTTPENHLKGGTFIKFHGLSVNFQNSTSFHPHPDDLEMGVIDSNGMRWDFQPVNREDLSDLHFSFMAPRLDGTDTFTFKIFKAPDSAEVNGRGYYSCILDSTYPVLGDMRSEMTGDRVIIDTAVEEDGSGIDISSLRFKITDMSGNTVTDWKKPRNPLLDQGRISFGTEKPDVGNYRILMDISDRVTNSRSDPWSFYMSTMPDDYHEISVDQKITVSTDPVIQGSTVHFKSWIRNNGNQKEESIQVEIIRDDEVFLRKTVEYMAAGSSREITWKWDAQGSGTIFIVRADPEGLIGDANKEDNSASISVSTEYRDLSARSDYVLPSNWNAAEGDVITLSFMVKNVGSIPTSQFKIKVLEGDVFLGQYIMERMDPDSSRQLTIDWIVDHDTEFIHLDIDPLNEITESVETNNYISILNPFFSPEAEDVPDPDEETGETPEDQEEVIEEEHKDPKEGEDGGTVWTGPESDNDEEKGSDTPPGPIFEDQDPPMTSEDPNLIPIIAPSSAIAFGLLVLGVTLLGFRFEPFRYRWALLMIPLYSKLKRSKIEKGLRFEILGYLKARPGANYTELKRNLDLNDGTLVHHLRILEREEKIYSKKMGKYKLFYASSYRRQSAIDDYISPFHKRILELISNNPGIVPKKLSVMLDRSQTDISYHLSELLRNGYLEKRKKGRYNHYYLNQQMMELMTA